MYRQYELSQGSGRLLVWLLDDPALVPGRVITVAEDRNRWTIVRAYRQAYRRPRFTRQPLWTVT